MNKPVQVNNPKMSGTMLFKAYIFRIIQNKKVYQAEVQSLKPPHEIYVVSLNDLEAVEND